MLPFHIHDIAILRAPAPTSLEPANDGFKLMELFSEQTAEIMAGHTSMGRTIPAERIERRFRHGLRFFQIRMENVLAGSIWIAHGTPRYIDEVGLSLPLLPNEIWLLDAFIASEVRGKKLFTQTTSYMTHAINPSCNRIWSDVDWSNRASMNAHLSAGFQIWKRVHAIDFANRLLLRTHIGKWHLPICDLEPERRVVWWNNALQEQHKALIA